MDDITRYSVFWNAIRSIDAFDASFPDNQWLEGLEGGGVIGSWSRKEFMLSFPSLFLVHEPFHPPPPRGRTYIQVRTVTSQPFGTYSPSLMLSTSTVMKFLVTSLYWAPLKF